MPSIAVIDAIAADLRLKGHFVGDPPLYRVTRKTAAIFLDYSELTLRNRAYQLMPPACHRISHRVWYSLADLIEFRDSNASQLAA